MWRDIYSNSVYRCADCGCIFEGWEAEKSIRRGSYEVDNGVGDLFANHTYYTLETYACPQCSSGDFYEYDEDEDEEEEDE